MVIFSRQKIKRRRNDIFTVEQILKSLEVKEKLASIETSLKYLEVCLFGMFNSLIKSFENTEF